MNIYLIIKYLVLEKMHNSINNNINFSTIKFSKCQ